MCSWMNIFFVRAERKYDISWKNEPFFGYNIQLVSFNS